MKQENLKIKNLATKITALRAELKASKEMANNAAKEVENLFAEKFPSDHNTETKNNKEEKVKEKNELEQKDISNNLPQSQLNDESKKAFRKIAFKIHPDKLIGLSDGEDIKKKVELYQKAQKALDEQDMLVLADISLDLGIDPPEITDEHIKDVMKKINTIKKEINHIESTYVWKWLFSTSKEEKKEILEIMFSIIQKKI
jgi:hypothetical protein